MTIKKKKTVPLSAEAELAYEKLLEGERFEKWSAEWMDLVRTAFVTGYQLGLRTPAPRLLEPDEGEEN